MSHVSRLAPPGQSCVDSDTLQTSPHIASLYWWDAHTYRTTMKLVAAAFLLALCVAGSQVGSAKQKLDKLWIQLKVIQAMHTSLTCMPE